MSIQFPAVNIGDVLEADGGFTCIPLGATLVVSSDEGGFFVPCQCGKHYLEGQMAEDGELIGFHRPSGGLTR
jgi:hypothetical protein